MNCFKHPSVTSVAKCRICGKGLCSECARIHGELICDDCCLEHNDNVLKRYKRTMRWMILTAFLGCYMFDTSLDIKMFFSEGILSGILNSALVIFAACMITAVPIGWFYLDKLSENIAFKTILILPVAGFAFFYFLKFMLSYVIGIFCIPAFIKKYKKEKEGILQHKEMITNSYE